MMKSNEMVERLIQQAGIQHTRTKSGWCLRQGLEVLGSPHRADQEDGSLVSVAHLIERHGIPGFYACMKQSNPTAKRHNATQDLKDPSTCFQSLCRIIVGQSVSGSSAQAAWKRLVGTVQPDELTYENILTRVQEEGVELGLQKPVGLSKAKAASLVDLATQFRDGTLSEEFLESAEDEAVRNALLSVRGIGPWSCDIFLMFYLERSNVLPLGDLGVRKGILKHFRICPQKDQRRVLDLLRPYEPYLSLLTYYMWKVVDQDNDAVPKRDRRSVGATTAESEDATPTKRRRVVAREVTP